MCFCVVIASYSNEIKWEIILRRKIVEEMMEAVKESCIFVEENFDIHIHNNRQLIEQGADEKGTFYKIYYKEEN